MHLVWKSIVTLLLFGYDLDSFNRWAHYYNKSYASIGCTGSNISTEFLNWRENTRYVNEHNKQKHFSAVEFKALGKKYPWATFLGIVHFKDMELSTTKTNKNSGVFVKRSFIYSGISYIGLCLLRKELSVLRLYLYN